MVEVEKEEACQRMEMVLYSVPMAVAIALLNTTAIDNFLSEQQLLS